MGKLASRVLEELVLSRLRRQDARVLVGPRIGEDAAVIDMGSHVLVVHTDPITEASARIGWYALNIASNDVAVTGAQPLWASIAVLLPEGFEQRLLEGIVDDLAEASRSLGVTIVGGHTEETPRLDRPIVVATVMGEAPRDRYVPTGGARPGDLVLVVKGAGIEGTAILATDFQRLLEEKGVSREIIRSAAGFLDEISVVKEALALAEARVVTAMHDPTEGGVLGGLVELALASGVRLEVWEDKVPVRRETRTIAEALDIDPLKLIGSGGLIATVPPQRLGEAEDVLRSLGAPYAVAGRATEGRGVALHRPGGVEEYLEVPEDEIARIWKKSG